MTEKLDIVNDVRSALRVGRRVYEFDGHASGFYVEAYDTGSNIALVTYKALSHTTFSDGVDPLTIIRSTYRLYMEILEKAGFAVRYARPGLLVGPSGTTEWTAAEAPKLTNAALAELRNAAERSNLDYYTRFAPGRNSIFVIRVLREGIRSTEVFYNEEVGMYRAVPRSSSFGTVHSYSLTKVVDFLRDELSD